MTHQLLSIVAKDCLMKSNQKMKKLLNCTKALIIEDTTTPSLETKKQIIKK
jgi:hypothetical protein